MTEVLTALIPIFWAKGLRRVFADVDPANEGSVQLLKKLGFRQTGQNIVEVYEGREGTMHMQLKNPDRGEKGGGGGSGSSSGDSARA